MPTSHHSSNPLLTTRTRSDRRGGVTVVVILFLIVMITMAVFAVDYGYLLVVRTDLQRAADAAALAGARELTPDSNGNQDLVAVKAVVREYVTANLGDPSFVVDEADIAIGRFDPTTVYTSVTLLNDGTLDTVRLTLRRDDLTNNSVTLFLARLIGIQNSAISASSTAVMQKASILAPGSDILPIAIPQNTWNSNAPGAQWTIYGDGRLLDDDGNQIPGNWGSLDVGLQNNSTSDISDQILNGLRQSDLDSLHQQNAIPTDTHFDADHQMWLSGDTGLSAGMKSAVQQSHDHIKLVPIFDQLSEKKNGGNLDFHIVGWGVVQIVGSKWNGNKNTYIDIKKSYTYDGELRPHPDLSNTSEVINDAFTSPILIE